jgi:hypothetical protein
MIKLLEPVTDFFFNIDQKNFRHMLIATLGSVIMLFLLLLYLQFNSVKKIKREMKKVNNERIQTKELLEKNEILKKQQIRVEELIAQDKQFKLKEFIDQMLEKLNISIKTSSIRPKELENLRSQGYEEIRMEMELVKLNTKQLTDLLNQLQQSKRIDIKKLEITKSKKDPTIDVQLIITTLQKKTEATDELEAE